MTTQHFPQRGSYQGVSVAASDIAVDVEVVDLTSALTADHDFTQFARSLMVVCSTAGNLVVQTLAGSADRTIPLPTGVHFLPVGVQSIRMTGTTLRGSVVAYL